MNDDINQQLKNMFNPNTSEVVAYSTIRGCTATCAAAAKATTVNPVDSPEDCNEMRAHCDTDKNKYAIAKAEAMGVSRTAPVIAWEE